MRWLLPWIQTRPVIWFVRPGTVLRFDGRPAPHTIIIEVIDE